MEITAPPPVIQEKIEEKEVVMPTQIVHHTSKWYSFVYFFFGISVGMLAMAFLGYFIIVRNDDLPNKNSQDISALDDELVELRKMYNTDVFNLQNTTEDIDEYICKTHWSYKQNKCE